MKIKLLPVEGRGMVAIYVSTSFLPLEVPFTAIKAEDHSFWNFKSLKKNNGMETLIPWEEKTKSPLRVLILFGNGLKE